MFTFFTLTTITKFTFFPCIQKILIFIKKCLKTKDNSERRLVDDFCTRNYAFHPDPDHSY